MNIRRLLFLVLLMIGPSSLYAQEQTIVPNASQEISSDLLGSLDDFRADVKTWEQTEIHPVMAQWKARFDASLSEKDRLELDVLRGEAAHLEAVIHERLIDLRNARRADSDEVGDMEDELDSLFSRRIQTIRSAIPFVLNGQKTLDAMQQEMEPRTQEWQNERNKQWEKWLDYNRHLVRSYGDADLVKRLDVLYRPDQSSDDRMRKRIAATRFVLWNGTFVPHTTEEPEPEPETYAKTAYSGDAEHATYEESVAPNPANEQASLSFIVPARGQVSVTLHDSRGRMVYMPFNGSMAAGKHTVEIPTSRFASGQYYYIVQINGVQQTGSFSVVH